MAIWNGRQGGDGVADVEQGITNKESSFISYSYEAINQALQGNRIPSWNDVQALSAASNKTGLQRIYAQLDPGTTRQSILMGFNGIGYGIWRIAITCKTANSTVTLEDQNLNSIWAFSRSVNIGSSFTLNSSLDYLWRSQLSGGIDVVKDSPSQVQVEVWFDYLYV